VEPPEPGGLGQLITRRILDDLRASFEREGPDRRDARSKPEGIVTIVFTDVEESSGIVARLGDERARDVIRRHDHVLRTTVKAHGGVEVERAGDGFMIAFSTAGRALDFAAALQHALHESSDDGSMVRVRVGMETGEVIAEEHGYFGGTVFRAARISELAGGEQVFVSHATALIAGLDRYPLTDLGERDLRGFGAQRVFELNWREHDAG